MATTGQWGLTIPTQLTPASGPDIPADIKALADSIDPLLAPVSKGTLGSRPPFGKVGQRYYATDNGRRYLDIGTAWIDEGPAYDDFAVFAPGFLAATARASAPTGWLLCDGAAVSRVTYAALFAAIGTTYGAGDGTTTFGVPDLRGRVPVGVDGAAARLSASDALGQSGGEEKHALTSSENGPHTHDNIWGSSGGTGPGIRLIGSAANTWQTPNLSDAVLSSGNGTPHNNMQPYQVVNWLIKT